MSNAEETPFAESNGERPAEAVPAAEQESSDERSQLIDERDRLREQWMRTAADFENFRKRSGRDLEDADRRAREQVMREFLPLVDNLERAATAALTADDVHAIAEGVSMVLRMFQDDVAGRLNLERLQTAGERFDPSLHEAIQQEESDTLAPGFIVREVVAGYRFRGKLLRPAMVVVSRGSSQAA